MTCRQAGGWLTEIAIINPEKLNALLQRGAVWPLNFEIVGIKFLFQPLGKRSFGRGDITVQRDTISLQHPPRTEPLFLAVRLCLSEERVFVLC
jgi:hypothetical protein